MIAPVRVMTLFTFAVKNWLMDDASLRLSVTEAAQLSLRDDQFVGVFLKIVVNVTCVTLLLGIGPMEYATGHLLGVALRRDAGIDRSGRPLNLRFGIRSVECFEFADLNRLISGWCRGVLCVGCDLWRGLCWGVRTASKHGEKCNAPTT